MQLLRVNSSAKGTFVEVQQGNDSYRSRDLSAAEVDFYCTEVVLAMLASAASSMKLLKDAIPEAKPLKKALMGGIGLSDNHKQVVLVQDGETKVLMEGPRWLIAQELQLRVGRALDNRLAMKGVWE